LSEFEGFGEGDFDGSLVEPEDASESTESIFCQSSLSLEVIVSGYGPLDAGDVVLPITEKNSEIFAK